MGVVVVRFVVLARDSGSECVDGTPTLCLQVRGDIAGDNLHDTSSLFWS